MLRRIQGATPADVFELLELCHYGWRDSDEALSGDPVVHPFDLLEFAAEHNAPDPVLRRRIVGLALDLDRRSRERDREFEANEEARERLDRIQVGVASLRNSLEGIAEVVALGEAVLGPVEKDLDLDGDEALDIAADIARQSKDLIARFKHLEARVDSVAGPDDIGDEAYSSRLERAQTPAIATLMMAVCQAFENALDGTPGPSTPDINTALAALDAQDTE